MKKSKLSESQIFTILKEGGLGGTIEELCRRHSISVSTYYKLKSRYEGLSKSDLQKLRHLEEENRRLKHMYAELSLDHKVLKEIVEKKLQDQ